MSSVLAVVPTKDRPGTISLSLTALALDLVPGDCLIVLDDGHRPASSDYPFRFATDLAMQRGIEVQIRRGQPQGIHKARARALDIAKARGASRLLMVDDDIICPAGTVDKLNRAFGIETTHQYTVPVIGLANNEAGVDRFGEVSESTETHTQQFVLHGSGIKPVVGGAWTCAIMIGMDRVDAAELSTKLVMGPSVVEDYVLTKDLDGVVDRSCLVWHVMSPEQGLRDWNGKALAYLRDKLGSA